jgi:hypothetical protein
MTSCLPVVLLAFLATPALAAPPTDDPAAKYGQAWTREVRWDNVVSIADFEGGSLEERLAVAQDAVAKKGGGVVFFPAGTYAFKEDVKLKSGVVLRGEEPRGVTDARKEGYDPPTKFLFPRYVPRLEGEGTPIDTAFKGISLQEPATASNCGVVHIAINRGHIHLDDDGSPRHRAGKNRLVLGCVLRNAAVADPAVPNAKIGQHSWQRFTQRHHAAVAVRGSNLLVANNRLPKSGDDNFTMKDYVVRGRGKEKQVTLDEVVFDYDNRPGLYVNDYGIGAAGGNPPDGTPETHPWGFRKGIVIRDNYIYATGRCAIAFCGDGVICAHNVIRFAKDVYRPTATGQNLTTGSSTNDNRAVQMRGWRWVVEGNDYEVFRNWAADRKYHINDGEGLMHEDHVNSTVRDSKLINNKGNTYISIYKTGGIDGLRIEGNTIRDGIMAVADRNSGRHPCKNVRIVGNTTHGGRIHIAGHPAAGNVVKDNRNLGDEPARLINDAEAKLANNKGFTVTDR